MTVTGVSDVVQGVSVVRDTRRMTIPEVDFPGVVHLEELTGEGFRVGGTGSRSAGPRGAVGGRCFVQKCSCHPKVLQLKRE